MTSLTHQKPSKVPKLSFSGSLTTIRISHIIFRSHRTQNLGSFEQKAFGIARQQKQSIEPGVSTSGCRSPETTQAVPCDSSLSQSVGKVFCLSSKASITCSFPREVFL